MLNMMFAHMPLARTGHGVHPDAKRLGKAICKWARKDRQRVHCRVETLLHGHLEVQYGCRGAVEVWNAGGSCYAS